jgi:hypothetical protein
MESGPVFTEYECITGRVSPGPDLVLPDPLVPPYARKTRVHGDVFETCGDRAGLSLFEKQPEPSPLEDLAMGFHLRLPDHLFQFSP